MKLSYLVLIYPNKYQLKVYERQKTTFERFSQAETSSATSEMPDWKSGFKVPAKNSRKRNLVCILFSSIMRISVTSESGMLLVLDQKYTSEEHNTSNQQDRKR